MICPLSLAHFFALGAFQIFTLLIFINPPLSPLPLLIFLALCIAAPFFPQFSFFLPITSKGKKDGRGVALTFDDGPDPATTPALLELLARHGAKATFFVTGVRAERYPELIRAILDGGHSIGNHSFNHSPFLMLKGSGTLRREVASAQEVLKGFGVIPLAFRPPVGITSSRLWRVLLEQGMFCVNFSLRACDRGNRRTKGLARKLLAKVRPGDIVLLHDISPREGDVPYLLGEFEAFLNGVNAKGLEILPLAQLIGKEVMQDASGADPHAAKLFYDGLAATYDAEQFGSGVSLSRTTECRLFEAQVPILFSGCDRVLEIGAGTGIFTVQIARNCREVVAADISRNMLDLLEQKAQKEGIENIRTVQGDAEKMELHGPFSLACAFSALEYLTDLPGFVKKIAAELEPGGAVYFITARTSFFRFFTQIGNAMRQGLWLKSHSRRQIEKMLKDAGFEKISISSHLLKCGINGGMLLEVTARKPLGDAGRREK
ncbi:polysaccharide deacetylase family protein [Geomonas sp. RF6]|uniref:polysaccharide deacetylase family protein n=1 Tax=Geomonas sp. RF6 TaxID=2897342 RepID=UPI001E5BF889|nr:polysaccharide deacetylase family protein [Geomonas sp. RF6]UFS69378.1 polysaccharide deacetylase family protein [Geomonas sp. RF6]